MTNNISMTNVSKCGLDDAFAAGLTPADLEALIVDTLPGGATEDPLIEKFLGPSIIRADILMAKTFPEPRWAVEGIFAEGLSIFAGPPKVGKSWLVLNVAAAVALGGMAIGKIPVEEGDVLYLALEDTERRLQERMAIILQGTASPERLHLATTWPTLADGAAIHLRQWLEDHRGARLVIVDTFAKLRGAIPGNQNLYAGDYAAAGELKRVADHYGVALAIVHHTRKMVAADPLDMVSGSTGLAGAADTTLVLRKEIGRSDGNLYIRGRDVSEADHALTFDPETCSWTLLGDAAMYRMSEERAEIIAVLTESSDPMSPKHIAETLGKKDGAVRYLLHKMVKDGEVDGVGGAYQLPPNTPIPSNGSGKRPGVAGKSRNPTVRGDPVTPNSESAKIPGIAGAVRTVRGVRGIDDPRRRPVDGEPGNDRWTA